ncbi:MAG: hypothetical protein RIB65_11185 [Ilumatobacter fluminis]|uniref:hypothetical protein n=1 Tax=Ilumatobacter fluminis TaxID=467091 RepID=UPI0032EB1479
MSLRRKGRDTGAAAIELPLAVGLLLMPIAVIVMLVPQWPERQTVARSAAKEAATLYANAPSRSVGIELAQQSVAQAAANHGLAPAALTVALSNDWCRACTVTASVTVDIPAVAVPFAGTVGAFSYTTSSSARIDDYRSLPGAATP